MKLFDWLFKRKKPHRRKVPGGVEYRNLAYIAPGDYLILPLGKRKVGVESYVPEDHILQAAIVPANQSGDVEHLDTTEEQKG